MNPGIVNKLDPVRVFVGKAEHAVDKDGQMEKDALAKMAAKIIIVVSKRCRPLHLLLAIKKALMVITTSITKAAKPGMTHRRRVKPKVVI